MHQISHRLSTYHADITHMRKILGGELTAIDKRVLEMDTLLGLRIGLVDVVGGN
jgi:hypothetical protein